MLVPLLAIFNLLSKSFSVISFSFKTDLESRLIVTNKSQQTIYAPFSFLIVFRQVWRDNRKDKSKSRQSTYGFGQNNEYSPLQFLL